MGTKNWREKGNRSRRLFVVRMNRQMLGPVIIGAFGVAGLIWLGTWQLERLGSKANVLARIEAAISAEPVALPAEPSADAHGFLPVTASGRFAGPEIHVLASNKDTGAGYRVIAVLKTGGRQILVDRGFIPIAAKAAGRPTREITVTGNLHWPDEVDSYTPQADIDANIWFARDVPALAAALNTEPVMIVARHSTGDGVAAFPVNPASIPNNHMNYAITWFLLAGAWFVMTVFLVLRIKRRANG